MTPTLRSLLGKAHITVLAATILAAHAIAAPAGAANDSVEDRVRGVVRAAIAATISSELNAQIISLPFRRGQSFKKDDVLVAFDCQRYAAELRAAEAEARATRITVRQNRHLLRNRAGGANDLAIALAKLAQATASADAMRIRLAQCIIKAPFDGRVSERMVDRFERPQANAPLLKIVKTGDLEVDLIVPSSWITWLRAGQRFMFAIDETGTSHPAEILHLGAVVDPVSRTMTVSARLLGALRLIRPGMSGTAGLAPGKQAGGR